MTFLNSAILAGVVAIAIPVILHFLLRQKPRRLTFPALRLIEQRRRQNVRRMRLRHFWLMLLRMLVVGGLVFALARPSLPPANYSLNGFELTTLLLVITGAIACYFLLLRRWKPALQPFQFEERRSSLRGWMTGGTLAALALVVGCPYEQRIAGEIKDPTPAKPLDLPVSGVMVFDASLSMGYQQEGETRLDVARKIALRHLEELPLGSRIAVADNATDHPVNFQSSLHAAQSRLTALEVQSVIDSLEERLRDALRAQEDDRKRIALELGDANGSRDRYVRRIYLFTDLAASGWKSGANRLQAELEKATGINLYVIDVGEEVPQNGAVTEVILSRERIAAGGDLIVSAVVNANGLPPGDQTLELLLTGAGGSTAKHGQVTVKVDPGTPVRCEFPVLTGVAGPLVHGEVRIAGADPLEFDNVRYFSASVTAAPKVLVISTDKADANELMVALAPFDEQNAARNRFLPVFLNANRIREADLSQYAAVCLVNVRRLADEEWYQLGKFVENGGGLAVFLGDEQIESPNYNRAQAQSFLPATLFAHVPQNDFRFVVDDRQHAVFWKFRQYESYGSWAIMENDVWVSRFWQVEPAEGASVIASYTNPERSPAILDRVHGRGRTLMATTAINLPENYRLRWSNLPDPLLSDWFFVAFAEQITEYVSRFTESRHNYVAGETPLIPLDPQPVERQFLLREPPVKQYPVKAGANEATLTIPPPRSLGHYDVVTSANSPAFAGFSVNGSPAESDLTRLTEQQLDDLLGKENYQRARSIEELQDDISAADLGQEVYPFLLMLLVVVFVGEHLVANWFYEMPGETAAA